MLDLDEVPRNHLISSQVQGVKVCTRSQVFENLLYIEIFERQDSYFGENWLLAHLFHKWVHLTMSIALI